MELIPIIFILLGIILGIILVIRLNVAIWTLLIVSIVVAGSVTYFFPQYSTIRWSASLISLCLFLRVLVEVVLKKDRRLEPSPLFIKLFLILGFSVLLSIAANAHLKEALIAAKNFFEFWSLPFAFFYVIRSEKIVTTIMKAFLIIGILELPISVIQNIFFTGKSPGDSVTGTFGGQIAGGGPNAAFTIFMVIQIAIVLSLANKKILQWKFAILTLSLFLIPVLFTNSKFSIIYFPIVFLIIFGKDMIRNPVLGISGLIIIAILGTSVLYYYYKHSGQYSIHQPKSISEYISSSISAQFTPRGNNDFTRITVITFWWQEHSLNKNPLKMLLGHGLGASKSSGIVQGHVAMESRYLGKPIGYTALPTILWDIGVVGAFLYVMIFVVAYFTAARLRKHQKLPEIQQAFMAGAQVSCVLFVMSLPYQLSIINIQAFNSFSMFILGYIAFWYREMRYNRREIV